MTKQSADKPLIIAGRQFNSRLMVGTGLYKDYEETARALDESATEVVTFAVRRTSVGQYADEPNLLDFLPPPIVTPPAA